jgi:hypothetical protein
MIYTWIEIKRHQICMNAEGLNAEVYEVEKKIQNPKHSKTRSSTRKHANSDSGEN